MDFGWEQMSVAEYAQFASALDGNVVATETGYWRRIRPLFFRPILPFLEIDARQVRPPRRALLGGYQYACKSGEGNSWLNLMCFRGACSYGIEELSKNKRRQVRLAAGKFTLRAMRDIEEFKRAAYPVYQSFYARTGYQYRADRRSAPGFSRWAEIVFSFPKVTVLGAYRGGALGGVSVSSWVGRTVMYSTFFCDDTSLRSFVSDLMLHSVRSAVRGCSEIDEIFVGMRVEERGLSDFYAQRGCTLVRKPARLHLNPVARAFLAALLPVEYARMLGSLGRSAAPEREAPGGLTDVRGRAAEASLGGGPPRVG